MTNRILPILLLAATILPPIPPLPTSGWPAPEEAEPFAQALLRTVPPADLAEILAKEHDSIPPILRNLGTALMSGDAAVTQYLSDVATAFARKPNVDATLIAAVVFIDPSRYAEDETFRERVDQLLPKTFRRLAPSVARSLLSVAPLDFDTSEAAAVAAKIAPRTSADRRVPFATLDIPDDSASPILASIFSLNSTFFTPEEAKSLIDAVHAASPRRRIIVLADEPMRAAMKNAVFLDDHSREFTPWPRDPFLVARSSDGAVVFINRPNVQRNREEDQNMVRAIVQELPPAIDTAWKHPRWTVAPTPFHNGHILLTPREVWISMHTVEQRARELLDLDYVPTENIEPYLYAVRAAARELEQFYKRPVRFVHPLEPSILDALIGGAGFDLDSIVTILPNNNALVGDITLGSVAGRRSPVAEWDAFRKAYHLRGDREQILAAQRLPRTIALQRFLDAVAVELQHDGLTVRRLPLLNVPTAFVALDDVPQDSDFLVTWNNVVLEKGRAEGFASLLPSMDAIARNEFAASGYGLILFPPLTHSIVLGGGYRCASNHVRPPDRPVSRLRRGFGGVAR